MNSIDDESLRNAYECIELSNDLVFQSIRNLDLSMYYLADIEQLPRNMETVRFPAVDSVSLQSRSHDLALQSAIYPQFSRDNVLNLPKKTIGVLSYFCTDTYAESVLELVEENTKLRLEFFQKAKLIQPNYHLRAKMIKRLFGDILMQTLTRHIPLEIDCVSCRFTWRRNQASVIRLDKGKLIKFVKQSTYPEDFKDRAIQALRGAGDVFKLSRSRMHPECAVVDSSGIRRLRKAHSPLIVLNTEKRPPRIGTLKSPTSMVGKEREKLRKVSYIPLLQGWYVQERKPMS